MELDRLKGPGNRRTRGRPAFADKTVCMAIDQDGERAVSRAEYQALVADSDSLGLFIDMTNTVQGGGHDAGHLDRDGCFRGVALTRSQAALLVELIERGLPLRATDFRAVRVNHADKLFEKARRLVDDRLSRYHWKVFHTLGADDPHEKRYHFQPPAGFRFLVIRPFSPDEFLVIGTDPGSPS